VLKKHGDSFAGKKTVRYQDVDPWNGWPLPVDAHEDMAISSIDEASVKADLHVSASRSKGDWLGLFPGCGYHRDDGVKGAIIPPGVFIVGYRGAAAGAESGRGVGVTEVEKGMLDSALLPDFSP